MKAALPKGCAALSSTERGSLALPPLARADGLGNRMRSPRQDGRPPFWERPSHALPDRKETSRKATPVSQGGLTVSISSVIFRLASVFAPHSAQLVIAAH